MQLPSTPGEAHSVPASPLPNHQPWGSNHPEPGHQKSVVWHSLHSMHTFPDMHEHSWTCTYLCLYCRVQMGNQVLWRGRRRPSLGWQVSGSRRQIFGPSGCGWRVPACLSSLGRSTVAVTTYVDFLVLKPWMQGLACCWRSFHSLFKRRPATNPSWPNSPSHNRRSCCPRKIPWKELDPNRAAQAAGVCVCGGGWGGAVQLALPSKPRNPELQRPSGWWGGSKMKLTC